MAGLRSPKPLRWQQATDSKLAAKLIVREEPVGDSIMLVWECPRCRHNCQSSKPTREIVAGLDAETVAEEPRGFWKPIPCECQEDHPGRPDGGSGCGFYADQYFEVS